MRWGKNANRNSMRTSDKDSVRERDKRIKRARESQSGREREQKLNGFYHKLSTVTICRIDAF